MIGDEKCTHAENKGVVETDAHFVTVNFLDNIGGDVGIGGQTGIAGVPNIAGMNSGDKSGDGGNEVHGGVLTGKIGGQPDEFKFGGDMAQKEKRKDEESGAKTANLQKKAVIVDADRKDFFVGTQENFKRPPKQSDGRKEQNSDQPDFDNSSPLKGIRLDNLEKREEKGCALEGVIGIRNKIVKIGRVELVVIEIDQKYPTGREEGNDIDDKIEDEKDKRKTAFADFFLKDQILIVFVFASLHFFLKVFDGRPGILADKTKREKDNGLKNTHKNHRNPDLASEMVEGKKDTGVKAERAAAKKPDKDNNKKDD